MIESVFLGWSPAVKGLLITSAVFGIIVGIIIALALIYLMQSTPKETADKKQKQAPRKQLSPKRHRKEAEARAALQARLMVASGTISGPTRR